MEKNVPVWHVKISKIIGEVHHTLQQFIYPFILVLVIFILLIACKLLACVFMLLLLLKTKLHQLKEL